MNKIFVLLLLLTNAALSTAQSDFYNKDIQYNILIDSPRDSIIDVVYEIATTDENGDAQIYQTLSLDSFLVVFHNDISHQDTSKNQMLFYIHGMWGGRRVNFNKAYKLMSEVYIDHEDSDISRIISLKWPGNKMEYKDNKKTLYSISDTIAEVFLEFVEGANLGLDRGGQIDLISHSLGTELFKEIVNYASENDQLEKFFDQIIVAAPDWDIDVFSIDSSLYNVQYMADRTHVYFSHRDMTLSISKNLNKQSRFGLDGPQESLVLPDNVYAVDVTNVKDDNNMPDLMTGHNYYRASPAVTEDMLCTMIGCQRDKFNNRKMSDKNQNVFYLSMPEKDDKDSVK